MMQIRPNGGGYSYAPYRDVAHNFPALAKLAIRGLAMTEWSHIIGDYLRYAGVKEEDFAPAITALTRYVELCLKPGIKDPIQAMQEAGMFEVPVAAQMAVMAKLGEVYTSLFFTCTREAHGLKEPQLGMDDLLQESEEAVAHLVKRSKCPEQASA